MKKTFLLLLALIMLPLFVERVDACSCRQGVTVCEAYQNTPVIFTGTITEVSTISKQYEIATPGEDNKTYTIDDNVYRVLVDEIFKGVKSIEIGIRTDTGDSCAYTFKKGERYLIYAPDISFASQLYVSSCSRTRLLTEANEDLDFLRGLPGSATETRISGRVFHHVAFTYGLIPEPASGVKVIVAGADKRYEVFTNSDGAYRIKGLPPGSYKVWAVHPDNRKTIERAIEIPVGGCAIQDIAAQSN